MSIETSRICKFCGGMIRGNGFFRGVYCSEKCWKIAKGHNPISKKEYVEALAKLGTSNECDKEMPDRNVVFEAIMKLLSHPGDGLNQKYKNLNLFDVVELALEIHPQLPAALIFLARNMTQREAADQVGLKQPNLAKYIKVFCEKIARIKLI